MVAAIFVDLVWSNRHAREIGDWWRKWLNRYQDERCLYIVDHSAVYAGLLTHCFGKHLWYSFRHFDVWRPGTRFALTRQRDHKERWG